MTSFATNMSSATATALITEVSFIKNKQFAPIAGVAIAKACGKIT